MVNIGDTVQYATNPNNSGPILPDRVGQYAEIVGVVGGGCFKVVFDDGREHIASENYLKPVDRGGPW